MSQKGKKSLKKGGKGEQARGPSRNDRDNIDGLNSLLSEANQGVNYALGRVLNNHGSSVTVRTSGYGSGTACVLANKRLETVLRNSLRLDPHLLVVLSMTTPLGKKGYTFEVVAVNLYDSQNHDNLEKEACSQIRDLIMRRCLGAIPPRPDQQDDGGIRFEEEEEEEEQDEIEVNLDDL
jgi:hypothetical protein